jgi:3-methyl-2-oxobutanoate hydroxymethyltransferase
MTLSPPKLFGEAKSRGEKLAMVSLYDAPTAALCCDAGADVLLVGDSLGNVILGHEGTVPVTVEDMLRHTAAVARGVKGSSRPEVPVIADLPFGSYADVALAVRNGAALMRAGAHGLKLEGAGPRAIEAVRALVEMGAPVVGHLGYTPQSALRFERVVQGRSGEAATKLLDDVLRLEEAGCCAVVLEVVPTEVARRVTERLSVSTIGIGAGPHCDGQVLVWHDLVGLTTAPLRFLKRYAEARELLGEATGRYVEEVRSGEFPTVEHGWEMEEAELRRWTEGSGE